MNGGTGTASNFYYVDGNDQVNGAGAFNAVIELVSGVTVQLGSAQYQHVQEFVANGGTNTVTVANTDADFVYLYGGAGNDTLTTGSGGGYLIGEGGTNVLTGGGGTQRVRGRRRFRRRHHERRQRQQRLLHRRQFDRAWRRHLQHRGGAAAECRR